MMIGDSVTYNGRPHVVVGFTPTSVKPALIELRDERTGRTFWIERDLLEQTDAQRAAFRVIRQTDQREEP